jgi:hypothetical protein
LQRGHISPATFAKRIAGLDDAEKKDLGSYSGVSSRRFRDELDAKNRKKTLKAVDDAVAVTGYRPSEALWAAKHPVDRVTDRTHRGQHQVTEGIYKGGWKSDDGSMAAIPGFGLGRLGGRAAKKAAGAVEDVARSPEAQAVVDALPGAKKARKAQEVGYHEERVKRAAAIQDAMKVGGIEGHQAALHALKGELPKLKYGALEELDQTAAERLFRDIQNHPDLKPYDKVHTTEALRRMISEGRVPTSGEMKQFEKVFGTDVAEQIADSAGFWKKASDLGVEIMNIPRAMKATLDLSAPFRQGLVLGARHPVILAKNLKPMVKAWKSEGYYDETMAGIEAMPEFDTMRQAGVHFTDLGHVDNREEAFASNLAETLTGGKRSPVRMSSRAYTAFLNKFRADTFAHYMKVAEDSGQDLAAHEKRDIANWVNTATGRGKWDAIEGAMVPATMILFSPRLLLSRLQLLNPVYYAQLSPFARKEAIRGMTQLAGAVSMTLYMAKMAGADVNMDPRNTDFGKIRFGNTRIDILGGLQQPFVAAYRIAKGESVSSTTGVMQAADRGLIARNFLGNKLAPVPGVIRMKANNENFAGDEFQWRKEVPRMFLPIGVENAVEGFKDSPEAGIANVGLGSVGFGVATYDGTPAKTAKARKNAALAKRGAVYVRNHEDRTAALKKEWKAHNLPEDPAAVKASRAIRDMDLAKKRAEKEKGDRLTPEEKARLAFRTYKRAYPERASVWQGRFSSNPTEDMWQDFYEEMRGEIAEPFKRYDVNMAPSQDN